MSTNNSNGTILTLLATGLLGAAGAAANARRRSTPNFRLPGSTTQQFVRAHNSGNAHRVARRQRLAVGRKRLGSRAKQRLSSMQKRLLHISKQFKHNPEAVIRTQEIVLTLAQDKFYVTGSLGQTISTMLDDIRYDGDQEFNEGERENQTGRLIRPNAGLNEYVQVTTQLILDNEHFAQFEYDMQNNGHRVVDLTRRSKYELLVEWIAIQMNRLVKNARKGRIQPIHCPDMPDVDHEGYELNNADHAIFQGMAKIMSGDPCFNLSKQGYNADTPERGIALIADWYTGIVDQAKIRNRPIGEFVGDMDFDEEGNLTNEGTYELVDIRKLTFDEAVMRSVAAHQRNSLIANARKFVGAKPTYVMSGGWGLRLLDPNSEAGHRANGARIGNIDTSKDFADETSYLGHCLGTTKWYRDQALRGTHTYYSIRNEYGLPRFTFEIELPTETNPKAKVLQLKGQCDVKPTARSPQGWGHTCANFGGGVPGTPFEEILDTQKVTEAIRLLMPVMSLNEVLRTGNASDLGGVKRVYNEHLDRIRDLFRYTDWKPKITTEVRLRINAELRVTFVKEILRYTFRPRDQQVGAQRQAMRQQQLQDLMKLDKPTLVHLLSEKVNLVRVFPWTADMWQTYEDYQTAKPTIEQKKELEAAAQQQRRRKIQAQQQAPDLQGQANRTSRRRR